MGPGVLLLLLPPNRGNTVRLFLTLTIKVVQVSFCFWFCLILTVFFTLSISGSNQAYRAISTGQLSALLHLHLRPIDVVVFHGPQGYLVLRGASRLDAFSGYPFRS